MIGLYILLGLVMDSLSMILLTVPIFWPIIAGLDFPVQGDDLKLWFVSTFRCRETTSSCGSVSFP